MATAWERLPVLRDRCADYYERIEYVRFVGSETVQHTCRPSIKNALAVEMVSVCGRVNVPDLQIVGGVNDSLDFVASNLVPFSVLIPSGEYTYAELGAALEGLIEAASPNNDDWSGTGYNPITSRFQFLVNKDNAELQSGTGPTNPTTAYGTLGFSTSFDVSLTKNEPAQGAAMGSDRSQCYHLASDFLGKGRTWGVNDSDGPTGNLLWMFPAGEPTGAVAPVTHHPPNLVPFAWGQTHDVAAFDLSVVNGANYISTGSQAPSTLTTFTGLVRLRFIVARNPEI